MSTQIYCTNAIIELLEFVTLEPWQIDGVKCWDELASPNGVAVAATGLGKSLLGLACVASTARFHSAMKLAVVVPTTALASQWEETVAKFLNISPERVGRVGGGASDSFKTCDALVFVLRSAQEVAAGRSRLARECEGHSVFLLIDECHRSGATGGRAIFDAVVVARLGLTATAQRRSDDALDAQGVPLPADAQVHVQAIGPIFFELGLKRARLLGLLPLYEVHHHGLALTAEEEGVQEHYRDRISNLRKQLSQHGENPHHYRRLKCGLGVVSRLALELENLYFGRKQSLYKASMRDHTVVELVVQAFTDAAPPRSVLVFHERTGADGTAGVERCYQALILAAREGRLPLRPSEIALEHSGLEKNKRVNVVERLRSQDVKVLVSAKALQEGIDLPALDMVVTVASTSSPLQRIQVCGRGLRVTRNAAGARVLDGRKKKIHHLYVAGTTDERVYLETDWVDELGEENVYWWHWELGAGQPDPSGPPAVARRDQIAPKSYGAPYSEQEPETGSPPIIPTICRISPRYTDYWKSSWAASRKRTDDNVDPFRLTYPDAVAVALSAARRGSANRVEEISSELARRAKKHTGRKKGYTLLALAAGLRELAASGEALCDRQIIPFQPAQAAAM